MAIISEQKTSVAENGIVSAETIRAYLENKLSDEERNEFEQFIASDPFAADALEGIRGAGNASATFLAIESIANHLRERSGTSKKSNDGLTNSIQINWTIFAYAGIVIGIIIAVGVIISFVSSKSKKESVIATTETVAVPAPTTVDSTTEIPKKDSVAIPIPQTTAPVVVVKPIPPVSTTTQQKDSSATGTADAMTLFNTANYIDAEKKFDEALTKSPNNYEAQYFSAVSAYINGNSSKAEKQFDYMLNNGLYVEGSKWYKACILLKKGDTATASEMLRSLSISSGIYKERAIKKLETLNQ
ncbi:MAG TPA: tetratricopeptide repeat protein [Chitinophagales bacterium]